MNDAYDMAELTVAATAFLYHEIRCIVSILYLIGLGKEDITVSIIYMHFNFKIIISSS